MLQRHLDAPVEHEGIIQVPAIGAGVAAHDAPLVKTRHAKVRRAGLLQPPRGKKIVLRARAPDRSLRLAVQVYLLVAFAEPSRAARTDSEHRADVMAFALRVENQV